MHALNTPTFFSLLSSRRWTLTVSSMMGIVSEGRVRFVPPWTSALTRMLEVGGKMSQLLLPVQKWRDGSNSVWTCWTPCSSGQLVTGTVLRLGPESHTLMQCRINARRWSQPTFVPDKAAFIHFPWAGSVQHNRPKQLIQKQEVIFVNWHGQVFNPGPFLQES